MTSSEQPNLDLCLRVARQIAREAGKMMLSAFHQPKKIEFKGRTDLVTETDKAIEDFVSSELKKAFPGHQFLGEETIAALQAAGKPAIEDLTDEPTWVVDPVDGTTNFVHALPYSCVSIGLAFRKEAVLGVVYNPMTAEMFTAIRGSGAFLNDSPIAVNGNSELVYSLVATGIPYDKSYMRDVVQGSLLTVQREAQGKKLDFNFLFQPNLAHLCFFLSLDSYEAQWVRCP